MAIYLIEGKLGAGKTLCAVGRIRDALIAGKRVATNLDIRLEHLVNVDAKMCRVIRLPDKPTVAHLEMIGTGNPEMDESKNGLIVVDEMAAYMNARSYGDKDRQPVIDWLIHSRKKGWDVYFICQNIAQIDKQVREALVEYRVTCKRFDRMTIPFLRPICSLLSGGSWVPHFPRVHQAIVRYGVDVGAPVADKWTYRGNDLFAAYDTRQVFRLDPWQAPYSYLPPYYTQGWKAVKRYRNLSRKMAERRRLTGLYRAGLVSFDEWRSLFAQT